MDHIIFGYALSQKARKLTPDELLPCADRKDLAWIHLDINYPETKKWLETELSSFEPFVLSELLAPESRSQIIQVHKGAVLLILRAIDISDPKNPEDMILLRMWIEKDRIITLRQKKIGAFQDLSEKIESGHSPQNSSQFICMITNEIFEDIEHVLVTLGIDIDNLEENILEKRTDISFNEKIAMTRKQAVIFRRHISPQREVFIQLAHAPLPWLTKVSRRDLQKLSTQTTRQIENLDAIRERAQVITDEMTSLLTQRLNRLMYRLSVISAIFMPLSFLTGLLGVNLAGIPGAENHHSFGIFCGMLALVILIHITLLKKTKWLQL